MNSLPIILASGSPRRKELLEQMGITFQVKTSTIEEIITKTKPEEVVIELSYQKAMDVATRYKEDSCIVIGADTIVWDGNQILGKPKDEVDAFSMIKQLQGNSHWVYTGVTIIKKLKNKITTTSFYEKTNVIMYSMSEQEITDYIHTKEMSNNCNKVIYQWEDKAGGYGIQTSFGTKFIRGIEGDYYNVVGLPVSALYQKLKEISNITLQ